MYQRVWIAVIACISLAIGIDRGFAACSTTNASGLTGSCTAPPDPACGTSGVAPVTWTNMCITTQCGATSVTCGSTCAYCGGGVAMMCKPTSGCSNICTGCSC